LIQSADNMKNITILMGVILLLGGCASIIDGTTQTVMVHTQPQGALCVVERSEEPLIGVVNPTPGSVYLKRDLK
jgi:hypothetical protein